MSIPLYWPCLKITSGFRAIPARFDVALTWLMFKVLQSFSQSSPGILCRGRGASVLSISACFRQASISHWRGWIWKNVMAFLNRALGIFLRTRSAIPLPFLCFRHISVSQYLKFDFDDFEALTHRDCISLVGAAARNSCPSARMFDMSLFRKAPKMISTML